MTIPWELGAGLTTCERDTIADSVREFQLGESAEGRHFVRAAKEYAARVGDREYIDAVRLLIGEEQRHARELAKFLELVGIPLAEVTWADTAFRWLRKRAGARSLRFGPAHRRDHCQGLLRSARTGDGLDRLAANLRADPARRSGTRALQSERLGMLRAAQAATDRSHATPDAHRALFGMACLIVWRKHAQAFAPEAMAFVVFGNQPGRKCAWHSTT